MRKFIMMQAHLRAQRLALSLLLIAVATSFGQDSKSHPPRYGFEVVRQFPHDPTAFTQGFTYHDGFFFEGTGRNGSSYLRQVRIETGEIVRQVGLAPQFFGEGITILGDKVIQLTWLAQTGFIYSLGDFRRLRSFTYPGEGWGLTSNGREVFMSDGTPEIRVLDPKSLREQRRIKVHDGARPISQLNELEFVEGEIFANVWQTNRIARISPQTGEVVGWIDLTGLLSPIYHLESGAVLNGIAYDQKGKRLFVTGKLWPKIFEIKLVAKR